MDGLLAKRILIALAKKLSFDSIRRVNALGSYTLKLVRENGKSRHLIVQSVNVNGNFNIRVHRCHNSKWNSLLESLVGMTVWPERIGFAETSRQPTKVQINGVEQLAIDLELEGYLNLKNA